MTTTTTEATTARELLDRLGPFGPAAEGDQLVFDRDPPAALDAALGVLHSGVRAALTGRPWWGCTSEKARMTELSPAARLPAGVTLLAVEGDECWDRIAPDARLDVPHLFAPAPSGPSRPR